MLEGFVIEHDLNFDNILQKSRRKLGALLRLSIFLHLTRRKILMETFIKSQFGFCTRTWVLFLKKDGSFATHNGSIQTLSIEHIKVKNGLSSERMSDIFDKRQIVNYILILSVPGKLKNSDFEMPIILQTLNINNLRTTNAKSINLYTIRKLIEYSLKHVSVKAMFTVFEVFLFEGRSVLSPAQRGTRSARAKISNWVFSTSKENLSLLLEYFKIFCGQSLGYFTQRN